MGENFFLHWFGMSVTQLKEVRETRKDLTTEQRKQLDELIAKKENEEKSKQNNSRK